MINIEDGDKRYHIRNSLSEISMNEYICLANMELQETPFIKKWMKTLKMLSSDDAVLNIDDECLFEKIIPEFTLFEEDSEFRGEVTIEGVDYEVELKEDGTPKLSIMALSELEDFVNNKGEDWPKWAIAYLFKRSDGKQSTIEDRVDLFGKNLKADVVIPYLVFISGRVKQNLERLSEIYGKK